MSKSETTTALRCPLCFTDSNSLFHQDKNRLYYHCPNCYLVFVPEIYHLSSDDEKKEYDLHNNNPNDLGYRKFLSRLTVPLLDRVTPGSKGLDFGCGPGPTLSVMLQEQGFEMDLFDLYYHNNSAVFERQYDFITSTEVVEHLTAPACEFKKLMKCLNVGGTLGIMTKLVRDKEAFSKWHYIQDRTHISFFSKKTFVYLSKYLNAKVDFVGSDVILIEKL